jgi:hypothetical protein
MGLFTYIVQNDISKIGTDKTADNIVYHALNQKDVDRLSQGLGLEAKNPSGTWKLDKHGCFCPSPRKGGIRKFGYQRLCA